MTTPNRLRDSHAILFSGGLDSMCAAVLNPSHQLLRVGTGSKYDVVEQRQSRLIVKAWGGRSLLNINDVLNLGVYEQQDALVPARNALIALVAAQHATELTLAAVAGDGTHATDKDQRFADMISELLAKLFGEGSVVLPYRKWSKLQLLKHALDFDHDAVLAALPHVWSCYEPVQISMGRGRMKYRYDHCGQCKACIRLHGALAWADVLQHADYGFHVDPFTLPMDVIRETYDGRGHEGDEVLKVHALWNTST